MTRRDKGSSASTPREHPRTPASATTSAGLQGKTNKTPALTDSVQSSWKRRSLPADWKQQPTLTQIDFVTRTPGPDEGELEYIDGNNAGSGKGNGEKVREVIDLDDDSNGDDLDYRPTPPPRPRRKSQRHSTGRLDNTPQSTVSRKVRFQSSNPPLSIKSSGRKSSTSKSRPRSKSGGKANTKEKKDKTLTQMDFVRRYVIIDDDDDDLNLDYIAPCNKENRGCNASGQEDGDKMGDVDAGKADDQQPADRRKKRKLNDGSDVPTGSPDVPLSADGLGLSLEQDNIDRGTPVPPPITPQKPRKFEIPSSQSPESPGLAIISSSQFRSATRSPLKALSPNTVEKASPKRPDSRRSVKKEASQSPVCVSLPSRNAIAEHSIAVGALAASQSLSQKKKVTPSSSPLQSKAEPEGRESPCKMKSSDEGKTVGDKKPDNDAKIKFEKTVVYETDAETDYSDFEDALSHISGPDNQQGLPGDEETIVGYDQESRGDTSDDLPSPVPNSGTDLEADIHNSEFTLSSDASIYYHRQQQCTQFPVGPIPTLSTQKLAELFPQHDSSQQAQVEASLPEPVVPATNHDATPQLPPSTQTETQTQTQTQTQDPEVVPESSLVQPLEPTNPANNSGPKSHDHEPVVLVESSQPVDRLNRQSSARKQDDEPRRILSTSQLLTDSLMESIPAPPPWISSPNLSELESLPGG